MKQGTNKLPILGNISRFPRNLLPQDDFHFSSLAGNQTDFFDSESGRILASLGVPDCGTSNHQAEVIFISLFFSIKDYNLNLMTPILFSLPFFTDRLHSRSFSSAKPR